MGSTSTSHFNTPRLKGQHTGQPTPLVDEDEDDYGTFDEEELDILEGLLEAHSLPVTQLPVPPPLSLDRQTSSSLVTSTVPAQIRYPDLSAHISPVPFSLAPPIIEGDDDEGRFDDADEDIEALIEAGEREFRLSGSQRSRHSSQTQQSSLAGPSSRPLLEIQYEESQGLCNPRTEAPDLGDVNQNQNQNLPLVSADEDDSPYSRYRGTRRGLSVTDLLSNQWCEQQFEFYLRRGKKRTTTAMRAGTKIHKNLEREVHETTPVEVITKEDRWGLKILNVIQGLRTLRETGMTRELPVFAFVKGVFVQGVVDEISYTKPEDWVIGDRKTTGADREDGTTSNSKTASDKSMGGGQTLMTDFMKPTSSQPKHDIAYISDCKTRVNATLPTASQFRGAAYQLMLYHYLITAMASSAAATAAHYTGTARSGIPAPPPSLAPDGLMVQLFSAHNLDPHMQFTDRFLAQMAPLLDESDSEDSPVVVVYPTFSDLLATPTLAGLTSILSASFNLSIPTLAKTLSVSYRSQQDGRLLATKTIEFDEHLLEDHLLDVLKWWKGERETVGVNIEEAWKCRSCEFADECEWRLKKVEELRLEKEREKEREKEEKKREKEEKKKAKGKGKKKAA